MKNQTRTIKLKPFDVLASIDIIISVRRLFIETIMLSDVKTPNRSNLRLLTTAGQTLDFITDP